MRRRKRRYSTVVVGVLALAALALTAGLLWRWVLSVPPLQLERVAAPIATPASPPAAGSSEEFSAAERQRLENILRQRNPGAQR